MPFGEIEAKSLGPEEELTREPCCKKLRSIEGSFVAPHRDSSGFHRFQDKTGKGWVPVSITDVRGHSCLQEDKAKTASLLKADEMPAKQPSLAESMESPVVQAASPPLIATDEIYSTSKAFIGPIYKPTEKKKRERRSHADATNDTDGKGGRDKRQKFTCRKSEIDTELSQFYKEIEELESEKDNLEGSDKEPKPPVGFTSYECHDNDLIKYEEEKKDLSNVLQSHRGYQLYTGNELDKYPCHGQVIPTFCDMPFTSFRPEWQSVHSFIVPRGPPLPNSNYPLNIQRFHAPPGSSSNIFHAQDGSQIRNGYYLNSCHVDWNCLTFDQNYEYTDDIDSISSDLPYENGYTVQNGYMSDGFCETSEGYWKDPYVDIHSRTDGFMDQHFQEEKLNKLQKLLILLRGLPGSGKTTLSRILLGQSRDGIVFSTDDYFHHQDGYRYNVNQLGDAHDWNQNRAKQAINQGRSPVIIDNTNTQAWEMKPYVEMAIGKGYRVEFHEPETWWKFDPEELEKRNKHGVSRKKIAQMLDRYEYQMSISIVMNSVEPVHKNTQSLPPSEERQRWGGSLGSYN